ncbi:hypothetical protein Phum_PHUM353020 [Pediculus humanus corporis]|uniref:Uncharacterized protein n=1 Tax=Pediculus humanus subsp. corporis TaxID=121224 RepID=E0VP68_PEDHC|nr:uncharacterized protein Phum_PHUM353020 [Pediculus humanus corporis]EEB15174.1 hypothetical protein Phum_PHUM353020 [Pediculus humanus corporis]
MGVREMEINEFKSNGFATSGKIVQYEIEDDVDVVDDDDDDDDDDEDDRNDWKRKPSVAEYKTTFNYGLGYISQCKILHLLMYAGTN